MVGGVVAVEPGEYLVDAELSLVDRDAGPDDPAHQAEPGSRLVRGGERRRPSPVDQRGIDIIDRPVRVEIAARKDRPDQCRAERRCGTVELVDIAVLGGAQHFERAAEAEILRIARPAMRRVEDQRHLRRLRIAAPQHAGDLEAGFGKLVWCGDGAVRFWHRANLRSGHSSGKVRRRLRRDAAAQRVQDRRLALRPGSVACPSRTMRSS